MRTTELNDMHKTKTRLEIDIEFLGSVLKCLPQVGENTFDKIKGILENLEAMNEGATQKEIGSLLGIRQAEVSSNLNRLIRWGFVIKIDKKYLANRNFEMIMNQKIDDSPFGEMELTTHFEKAFAWWTLMLSPNLQGKR